MLSSLVETCVVAVSGEHFKPGSKSPDQEAATGQHEGSLSETAILNHTPQYDGKCVNILSQALVHSTLHVPTYTLCIPLLSLDI